MNEINEINEMLRGIENCTCGASHNCDIQNVIIGNGVLKELPELCKEYKHIILVADTNTYATCGDRVSQMLEGQLQNKIVFSRPGFLIPDESSIDEIKALVTADTDLILGIGSGVINDLCKYVSFLFHLPYDIIATAPSMDGYASNGAAMIIRNMKTTFPAHVPNAIIGDTDILKEAPMRMIQAGFGDIIGKYSALNDWKLSNLVNGETFCDRVYRIVYDTLQKTEHLAVPIRERSPEGIQALMEALVIVGIAMSYVGNSRPASGSEHHLSHYLEITGILNQSPYFPHGIDVAYATVQTQLLREQLLSLPTFPKVTHPFSHERWETEIHRNHGKAAGSVIALQDQCGFYQKDYCGIYETKWDDIRCVLSETPSSSRIGEILQTVGLDIQEFEDLYGKAKIQDSIWFAKDLKDRYTVLWLYFLLYYPWK